MSPYCLKLIALNDKITRWHSVSWEAKARTFKPENILDVFLQLLLYFRKKFPHSFSCLVWEISQSARIKYQIQSLLNARNFSTTKLSLWVLSLYFNDSMNYTTVYMLSYWRLSTKILGVSKGTFMKKISPNQMIILHIKW